MTTVRPLRALLICPNEDLRREVGAAVHRESSAEIVLEMEGYPSGTELGRAMRSFSPECVLLSFEKPEVALAVMRFLEAEAEGLPVVAIHPTPGLAAGMSVMRGSMRAGAREFLTPPIEPSTIAELVGVVRRALKRAPLSYSATDHIYSFLPARAGVGTTTVATNTSAAFASIPGMKVLLTDLDLSCGMIRFLWKLPHNLSIVDALARAEDLDTALWPQLISERDGVDVLHSGSVNPQAYLEGPQIQSLIDFARASYNALFFDLSGNLERYSIQVMQESKHVFLVCNPEQGSLFQAHQKLQFLRNLGLEERVSIVVNRANQELALPIPYIEKFLGVPVGARISDDHQEMTRSATTGHSLFGEAKSRKTGIAREFLEFARALRQSGRVQAAA